MIPETNFYYSHNELTVGPFDLQTLTRMRQAEIITEDTPIRRESDTAWIPFSSLVRLDAKHATYPSLIPASQVVPLPPILPSNSADYSGILILLGYIFLSLPFILEGKILGVFWSRMPSETVNSNLTGMRANMAVAVPFLAMLAVGVVVFLVGSLPSIMTARRAGRTVQSFRERPIARTMLFLLNVIAYGDCVVVTSIPVLFLFLVYLKH